MADTELLDLTELTTIVGDENIYLAGDPSGTPIDRRASLATLALSLDWSLVSETWTRTGDHTFTITGDFTAKYTKGLRVRYKDGGGSFEYGVVANSAYSSPNTTVTLITTSSYAMAAATITDRAVSRMSQPAGWPDYFSWTPTLFGFSANPQGQYRWRAEGRTITITLRNQTDGTSNSDLFTITLPVAAATITNMAWAGPAGAVDNGAVLTSPSRMFISSAWTEVQIFSNFGVGVWTTSGGKRVLTGEISYFF